MPCNIREVIPAVFHRNSVGDRQRLASGGRMHRLDFKQAVGDPGTLAAGGYNINVLTGELRHGLEVGRMTSPRMNANHCALFCSVVKRATHFPSEWTA